MAITLPTVVQSLDHVAGLYASFIVQSNQYVDIGQNQISWHEYIAGIEKTDYSSEYQLLLDSRQYTFLFKDDSFCQLFYRFSAGDVLTSARLAYFPVPERKREKVIEAGFDDGSEDVLSELESGIPAALAETHLRLDFDSAATRHDQAHIQFSTYNTLRIPADKIVLPLAFLDFIFRNDEELHPFYSVMSAKAGYASAVSNAVRLSTLIELACVTYYLTHR